MSVMTTTREVAELKTADRLCECARPAENECNLLGQVVTGRGNQDLKKTVTSYVEGKKLKPDEILYIVSQKPAMPQHFKHNVYL